MAVVRFVEVELEYGRHAGVRFALPDGPAPVVVAGPNGAGKTTLLEALARAPFGFHRRTGDDRTVLEARRPWAGERCRARVVIAAADGSRWAVERDFGTARVRIERLDGAGDAWSGDGNPGADNPEAREWRRRLAALIGLADFEAYRATACIHQGELAATRLERGLLRVAAGGHGDVEAARDALVKAHRELTQRPIEPGVRGGTKPRALEEVEAEIAATRELLGEALDAEAGRKPLLEARAEATSRMDALRAEIERLEAAQGPLLRRRAHEEGQARLKERVRTLQEARAQAEAARDAARPRRALLLIAGLAAVAGLAAAGALALTGRGAAGLAVAGLAIAGGAVLLALDDRARRERERRREGQEAAARRLAGLDDGGGRDLLAALADALEDARRDLAKQDLALETAGETGLALPDGVPAEPDAVARALAERRAARDDLGVELLRLDRQLLEQEGGEGSPVALRDRLAALEARRAELAETAAAHEAAYALIRDAYEEFRARDEERLLARVSERAMQLTAGALGPVEAPRSLADARIRLAGRPVPLATPPLSYGEWHAVLLAIRLGAADFLAGAGVALPLLVDEPFAFLDPDRARGVWRLLHAIARERQVIVATQDRLTLEWLGVAPDIELAAAPAGR